MSKPHSWVIRVVRIPLLWALLLVLLPFPAFGQNDGRVGALVAGEGRDETVETCTRCHYSGQFVGERLSREDWEMVMFTMIGEYEMPVPADGVRDKVLDYLSIHFGPEPGQ
ncbi:MAG: hypothetical protein HKM95_08450 [Inquilinus sp.]|nr:hypothetical protein [Inquilinus sp.]